MFQLTLISSFTITLALAVTFAHSAFAVTSTTTSGGPWTEPLLWDMGVPDGFSGDDAVVNHTMNVFSSGMPIKSASTIYVGSAASAAGNLGIIGGTLVDINHTVIGDVNPAICRITDGTFETSQLIGNNGGSGTMRIIGGTFQGRANGFVRVGFSAGGELIVEGSAATIAQGDAELEVLDAGTFVVRPTANGAAGLTTYVADDLTLHASSTLRLDTSLYTPVAGDEWDVVTYGGVRVGSFGGVSVDDSYLVLEADYSVPGVVTLRVDRVIVPSIGLMGQIVIVAALAAVGGVFVASPRARRTVS